MNFVFEISRVDSNYVFCCFAFVVYELCGLLLLFDQALRL